MADGNGKEFTYELTYKDAIDILEIIDRSTCGELHLQLGGLNLTVIKKGVGKGSGKGENTTS
jgi:hypothetical protein